jgi:iron complex transport system ATP-binding protein
MIEVRGLSHSYGEVEALIDISVRADAGRVNVIIGPNASGKSTLLRCIIGALRPARGAVHLNGTAIDRLPRRQRAAHLAYVPQRADVSAAFTVREVIELGRYALPRDDARVDAAIEQLDLTDLAHRPYATLSVGQQQRVTLARAVAQVANNGVLVLDEPTSAMDLRHVTQCLRMLRQMAADGRTIIMAMHDLTMAATVADQVWLMNEGRLHASGETDAVMQREQLEAVFGVRFEVLSGTGRHVRLVPAADDVKPA